MRQPHPGAVVPRVDAQDGLEAIDDVVAVVKHAAQPEPGLFVPRVELNSPAQQTGGHGTAATARGGNATLVQVIRLAAEGANGRVRHQWSGRYVSMMRWMIDEFSTNCLRMMV